MGLDINVLGGELRVWWEVLWGSTEDLSGMFIELSDPGEELRVSVFEQRVLGEDKRASTVVRRRVGEFKRGVTVF